MAVSVTAKFVCTSRLTTLEQTRTIKQNSTQEYSVVHTASLENVAEVIAVWRNGNQRSFSVGIPTVD